MSKSYKIWYNSKLYNSDKYPKRYRAEFIEPGIISYEDIGMGKVYVGDETLSKMNQSFIGRPVVNVVHQDLSPEEAFRLSEDDLESLACGVVYDVGKLPNGWYYCDMIIWDEATKYNIDVKGFSCSCAYVVNQVGVPGEYHGIKYDEEILDGVYTHNAIVERPRYERSKVYAIEKSYTNSRYDEVVKILTNSKGEKVMAQIFKHLFNARKEKTETVENSAQNELKSIDGAFVEVDGEKISLENAISAYKTVKENEKSDTELKDEDKVDVDGELVNVADLKNAYRNMCGTKKKNNAEPVADTEAEEVSDMENAEPVADTPAEEVVMSNSKGKHFKVLKNAMQATEDPAPIVSTKYDNYKRGQERYGSKEVK